MSRGYIENSDNSDDAVDSDDDNSDDAVNLEEDSKEGSRKKRNTFVGEK